MTNDNPIASDATSIGNVLANERNKRGIRVHEVSAALHLPSSIIHAIEADRFDDIAPVFLRGYVRLYADFLEQPAAPLLECIDQQDSPELRSVLVVNKPSIKLERLFKFATYVLVTTIIVPPLIYFFVVGGVAIFEKEVAGSSPVDTSTQPVNVSQRIAQALAAAESQARDSGPGHMAASTVPFANLASLDQDAAEIAASAPMNEVVMATLELHMQQDSWVEIESADGQRLEFDLLRSGSQHRYQAQAPFKLLLGRANAVDILINGEAVEFSGQDQGSVVELMLGEQSTESASGDESG